jgi:hypothetical protein
MEHHDYVALPQEVWRYINAWYTTDWTIIRHLRRDKVNNKVVLDLYPGERNDASTRLIDDGDGALTTDD